VGGGKHRQGLRRDVKVIVPGASRPCSAPHEPGQGGGRVDPRCRPFAMWPAFPVPDYYGGPATSRPAQPTTSLPAPDLDDRFTGPARDASHVHRTPVDGAGAQLCPCGIATSTPQAFLVDSLPATSPGPGATRPPRVQEDLVAIDKAVPGQPGRAPGLRQLATHKTRRYGTGLRLARFHVHFGPHRDWCTL